MKALNALRVLTPGAWLSVETIVKQTQKEAQDILSRHDVPQGPDVPADLRDVNSRYFLTASGSRVAGRLFADDAQIGGPSSATPLLFALLPVLTVLTLIAGQVLGLIGVGVGSAALAVVAYSIGVAAGWWWAAAAALVSIVLPFSTGQLDRVAAASAGFAAGSVVVYAIPVLLVAAIFAPGYRSTILAILKGLVAILALAIVAPTLGPTMQTLLWLTVSCALTPAYCYYVRSQWALALAIQGQQATFESTGPTVDTHKRARAAQAVKARADKSAKITLATALGIFTRRGDGFAPDPGLALVLSAVSAREHLVCMGASGTFKTSGIARPFVVEWLRSKAGGVLLLDAKYALPGEFRGLRDYILIEPGVRFALLQGLQPDDVVIAIENVVGSPKEDSGSGGSNVFFHRSARAMLHHICVLLRALIDVEIEREAAEKEYKRQWKWTLGDLCGFLQIVSKASDAKALELVAGIVAELRARHPKAAVDAVSTLADSIAFVEMLPNENHDTLSNIVKTLESWLTPIMHNESLQPFASIETGIDPTVCLRGKTVGVCLDQRTGVAGAMVQSFVKTRVFAGILSRGNRRNWRNEGETDVAIIQDEAAAHVGKSDTDLLPRARSLGGCCVYLTQQYESFAVKLGGTTEANDFLANFQSFVVLRSSPATFKWAQDRLGATWSIDYQSTGGAVDYRAAYRMLADSPLADPTHPGRRFHAKLLRRGAGAIFNPRKHRNGVASRAFVENDLGLTTPAVAAATWKQQPLLQDGDVVYLAEAGVAVVEVMRGGVRRRDIAQLHPMHEVPADLLKDKPTQPGE